MVDYYTEGVTHGKAMRKIKDYIEWNWHREDVDQALNDLAISWCSSLLIELCAHKPTVKYCLNNVVPGRDSRYLEIVRKLVRKVRPCAGKDKALIDIISQKW